ncbi:uncharacterized protein [Musca autumnalis]|uniref:uncharacterized protein n=1 Tax=Musca autumnalis TaxID=221902 RepID=UPI003CEFF626
MRICKLCKKKAGPQDGIRFFSAPKDDARRLLWSKICGVELSNASRLCSDHFNEAHILHCGKLLPTALPTLRPTKINVGQPPPPQNALKRKSSTPNMPNLNLVTESNGNLRLVGKTHITIKRFAVKKTSPISNGAQSKLITVPKTSNSTPSKLIAAPRTLNKNECKPLIVPRISREIQIKQIASVEKKIAKVLIPKPDETQSKPIGVKKRAESVLKPIPSSAPEKSSETQSDPIGVDKEKYRIVEQTPGASCGTSNKTQGSPNFAVDNNAAEVLGETTSETHIEQLNVDKVTPSADLEKSKGNKLIAAVEKKAAGVLILKTRETQSESTEVAKQEQIIVKQTPSANLGKTNGTPNKLLSSVDRKSAGVYILKPSETMSKSIGVEKQQEKVVKPTPTVFPTKPNVTQSKSVTVVDNNEATVVILKPIATKKKPSDVGKKGMGGKVIKTPGGTEIVYDKGEDSDSDGNYSDTEERLVYTTATKMQRKLIKDQKTQTRPIVVAAESNKYSETLRALKKENKQLKEEVEECNIAINAIRKIFTENQVRKLKQHNNSVQWLWPEVASSLALYATGPRAYRHLHRTGFPIPALSTLQRWTSTLIPKEGLLTISIDLLKHDSFMTAEEKFCVLSFEEMKVSGAYEFNCNDNTLKQPPNSVNVVLASGLKTAWKQPVYFDFDCRITKEILMEVISALSKDGFPVVGIVCDMTPLNRELLNDLDITPEKPWFSHPVKTEDKVFTFLDVPNLLKCLRNQFLYTGYIINNQTIDSTIIRELLKLHRKSNRPIKLHLVEEHLVINGKPWTQGMKPATQLFSNTTANALRKYSSLGLDFYKATETANFIQIVNDWFDIHNSSLKNYSQAGKEAYGKKWEIQKPILDKMNEVMSQPIVPNKSSLEFFQQGILITNTSLEMMYQYLKKYDFKHILTRRLNLDGIQHFFSIIRGNEGEDVYPSPDEFKIRMRKYILARNTQLLSGKAFSDSTDLIKPKNPPATTPEVPNSLQPTPPKKSKKGTTANDKDVIQPSTTTPKDDLDEFNSSIIEQILRGDVF